jgi:KRAB domain-containing zinc finger protein
MVVHDNWDVKTDINNTDQDQDDETNSKSKNVKISFHPSGQIKLDPMSSVSKKKPAKVQKVKNPKPEKPVVSQQLTISSEEDFPVSDKYTCQQCNEKCPSMFDMSEHNFMFHCSPDNRMYQCPTCNYTCPKGGIMRKHIKHVHCSVKVGCPKCNRLIRENYLQTHLENEHSDTIEKKFKCTYEADCTFSAAKKVNLLQHIQKMHKRDEHTQKCDRCDKTFVYPSDLKQHVEKTHLGLRPFVCEKCGKGYLSQNLLAQHQAKPTCKHSGAKQYKCETCNIDFCVVLSYVKHYHMVHGSQPPNMDAGPVFLCDSCPKMYINQRTLEKHRREIHEGVPKGPRQNVYKLQCPHCEKRLPKSKLEEHILSKHEMNTPYKCDQCTRSFGTASFLQTHKKNLHQRVNCDLCGQNICNTFWLKRHKASAHGITPKGSYQCPYCPLFFNLKGALENHVKKQHAETQ